MAIEVGAQRAVAFLKEWSASLIKEAAIEHAYLFGSLIYRDGTQFNELSDVDLVVVLPESTDNAIKRVAALEKLLIAKEVLEQNLLKQFERKDASGTLCSVVAVTLTELRADVHKDALDQFFSVNRFLNLSDGRFVPGLPGAGSMKLGNRFQSSLLRFCQKKRNSFLSRSANGMGGLPGFDGVEPVPKDFMRQGAMAKQLHVQSADLSAENGAEYDVQYGLDYISHLLYERQERDPIFKRVHDLISVRRGARGKHDAISGADQLLLAEIFCELAEQSIQSEIRRQAVIPRRVIRRDSTEEFAARFGHSFPGVRGIEWFDDEADVVERLGKLLEAPLVDGHSTPVWWWRDGNMHIESFAHVAGRAFLMDGIELNVHRIAAVYSSSYYRYFVYVECLPSAPTGLYAQTPKRIAEVKAGDGDWSYYWEEYGLVDGSHLITRGHYDDGAAKIEGKLQSIHGRVELRQRYVTPYNFVIAPNGSPINNPAFDQDLARLLDGILRGTETLEDLRDVISKLPKR